uniref:Uncharacterized protein n=1 Tax=Arion vulgaris TaxID=1028688 RepID=A0A0B7BC85_9EUPU
MEKELGLVEERDRKRKNIHFGILIKYHKTTFSPTAYKLNFEKKKNPSSFRQYPHKT